MWFYLLCFVSSCLIQNTHQIEMIHFYNRTLRHIAGKYNIWCTAVRRYAYRKHMITYKSQIWVSQSNKIFEFSKFRKCLQQLYFYKILQNKILLSEILWISLHFVYTRHIGTESLALMSYTLVSVAEAIRAIK